MIIGVRGGGGGGGGGWRLQPPGIFQVAIFGQKQVIFGQNHLKFGQAASFSGDLFSYSFFKYFFKRLLHVLHEYSPRPRHLFAIFFTGDRSFS